MSNLETEESRIDDLIRQLDVKYLETGQDLASYLEGLRQSDYLNYWEYIRLETLMTLQNPRTHHKDEMVFIIYHQITELIFKLILHEASQISELTAKDDEVFLAKIRRIEMYFRHLSNTYEIMTEGMDVSQFMKFRMALLPSSGFQSVQFRMIEICMTHFKNLLTPEQRETEMSSLEEIYDNLYWKKGATEAATGKKTLTLRQFEKKYTEDLLKLASAQQNRNVAYIFENVFANSPLKEEMIKVLRSLDMLANVHWRMAHLKAALHYLNKNQQATAATGGTNWQKYLPSRFQKIMFFPNLFSKEEVENWGTRM